MAALEAEVFRPEPVAYQPNNGLVFPVALLFADVSLRQFFIAELKEARRIGYPRMTAFAVDIARGTLGLPPPTEDDPIHEAVGAFYGQLKEIDRLMLALWYLPGNGTLKQKAKRISKSVWNYKKAVERLIGECKDWLEIRGFR